MRYATILAALLLLCGCQRVSRDIEPVVARPLHEKELIREKRYAVPQVHPSFFPSLTTEERATDWGKEYEIGFIFAQDFDLYRAITSFKRALILLGSDNEARRLELNYYIALSYYLGHKYVEVVYMVESGLFSGATEEFLAYQDLLVMLYDSYDQLGECEKARAVLSQIEEEGAEKIVFFSEVAAADLVALQSRGGYVEDLISCYCKQRKSVRGAQRLNMILPGAGYWYVGQRQTAVTAFLVNGLFIGATVHFFMHDNIAAGVIFASLESGWYFGGITGAGLAAKTYNERLYESYAQKICTKEQLYPLLRLNYKF